MHRLSSLRAERGPTTGHLLMITESRFAETRHLLSRLKTLPLQWDRMDISTEAPGSIVVEGNCNIASLEGWREREIGFRSCDAMVTPNMWRSPHSTTLKRPRGVNRGVKRTGSLVNRVETCPGSQVQDRQLTQRGTVAIQTCMSATICRCVA